MLQKRRNFKPNASLRNLKNTINLDGVVWSFVIVGFFSSKANGYVNEKPSGTCKDFHPSKTETKIHPPSK